MQNPSPGEDDPVVGLVEMLMTGLASGECRGCDQCDADVVAVHHSDSVGWVEIRHDHGCPEWARFRQGNHAELL